MSVWQSEEERCAVVLDEVFSWLDGAELARAGAACRAWRRAAAAPNHWRRLLLRRAAPTARALLHGPEPFPWRQEYVAACAGWRLRARTRAGAALLHAAAAPARALLALGAADASAAVWRRRAGAWREAARADLRPRGWSAVARVQWAAASDRLLLAGPLALSDHWELLVLRVEEHGRCGAVCCRVRCSAGAAGCWLGAGDSFLSLELSRLGVGLYCTTVWLNAATQETQSEFAGVTVPLLRVFNDDAAHFTQAVVAAAPSEESPEPTDHEPEACEDAGLAYVRAVRGARVMGNARLLVLGAGSALHAWRVRAPRPPPLQACAEGGLAERVRRHRARAAAPPEEPREPSEASVRAVCTPPAHSLRLDAPLVGLALHERGRCLWAVCADGGAVCAAAAGLAVLARVRAESACGPAAHLVQPAAGGALLASPAGGYSARVHTWAAASLARGAALAHGAPAVGCVLARRGRGEPRALLVLAGDELYEWHSRSTAQSDATDTSEHEHDDDFEDYDELEDYVMPTTSELR